MRNLKLIDFNYLKDSLIEGDSSFSVDTDAESVIVVNQSCIIQADLCRKECREICKLDDDTDVVDTEYLNEKRSICVATKGGNITLFDTLTKQVECVGFVSTGIQSLCWSPDQELLATITGEGSLILMTKDFDPLLEKYIHSDEFGENKPVTAGWGSKETQFQGSIGKEAAKKEKPPVQPVFPWDDKLSRISWRGDGQMFVTSTVHPDKNHRQLRIWERDGTLLSTSEDVNGLESALHWRPSGNLIASTQTSRNKHEVVFFEKNGLRHGEFKLPFKPQTFNVKGLSWNSNSTVLAIWGCDLNADDSEPNSNLSKFTVMLWTTSNYEWYQKQTFTYEESKITCVKWDVVQPFVLRVSSNQGYIYEYSLYWTTSRTTWLAKESAIAAVVQGPECLLTPFSDVVIPPPMSAEVLKVPDPLNDIVFGSRKNPEDVILVTCDNSLALFRSPSSNVIDKTDKFGVFAGTECGNKTRLHKFVGMASLPQEARLSTYYHWIWVSEKSLICVNVSDEGCRLVAITVYSDDPFQFHTKILQTLDSHVTSLCAISCNEIAIQYLDGSCGSFTFDNSKLQPWLIDGIKPLKFPNPAPTMDFCIISNKNVLVGLATNHRLFLNDREIANNCTSFSLHRKFLLLTTHKHTLRCLTKDNDLPKLLNGAQLESVEDAPRALERGSRLVLAVPHDTKVILQMPRGNLETIHPRPLVLNVVCQHLDKLEFKKAFEIMKKHRINLNLMFDHNPKLFLENTIKFVEDVGSVPNINLFLTELIEDDVCRKMYVSIYRGMNLPESRNGMESTKIDQICDAMRNTLESIDKNKYLLSILTTYAKKSVPQLDSALKEIKKLQVDLSHSGQNNSLTPSDALQYLMYMVDINHLYDVALGTYDFEIVLMVAEKSQKDPKEFLPFLNELKTLESNYRKYKIDMHLRRYKKALVHISNCGDERFTECLDLIKNQRLYSEALHLFPFSSDQNKVIWQAYGEYLLQKKHYEEAGVVFYRTSHYKEALEAYQKSGNWQLALCAATELGYTSIQEVQLAKNMADYLKSNRRYTEAAYLYETYVKDSEESIATLVEGHQWNSALNQISRHKRADLLETHLKPALMEQCAQSVSNIDQMSDDFNKYTIRLQVVRENQQKTADFDDQDDVNNPDNDMFSDTSSISGVSSSHSQRSRSSRSGSINTRKSSKHKQKHERKKYLLKEGSAFEDLALLTALTELIVGARNLTDNVTSLLTTLVAFGYEKDALSIQKKLDSLLKSIMLAIPSIWPPESREAPRLELGPSATANEIAAAMQNKIKTTPLISDPHLRQPPNFHIDDGWKLQMLDKST